MDAKPKALLCAFNHPTIRLTHAKWRTTGELEPIRRGARYDGRREKMQGG